LLVKIIPNRVLIFEVRKTISCNSGLVSVNFSCAILDHFINSFGITMVPALEEMGIQVLVNENTLLKRGQGTLFLAGIDDAHYFCADDIPKAANGMTDSTPTILLSHTPAVYKQAAEAGFDLILAGHTHGGQIFLPGGIPILLDSDCPYFVGKGAWRYNKLQGYTSVGSGTSMVNVRINCLPEITLHTLI
jgi:predicted MPP superfamily phosphohydrolase